ncbi:MAG: hypothetical protein ABJZ55_19180 [Fuerstiella sp.]
MLVRIRRFLKRNRSPIDDPAECMPKFHQTQKELAEHFLNLAAATGKPRGLKWKSLDFVGCWKLIREVSGPDSPTNISQQSNAPNQQDSAGLLTLIHSVNLHFEAIEGSDMEGVAAVSTVRDGCAIFHYRAGRWGTGGRVLLNLTVDQALQAAFSNSEVIADSEQQLESH